ncbi:MAG: glycosyltransferase [Acidobacteria bacterium]|nr:glycosyltransferase [Acidobacteriota bacterium]
MNVLFLSQIVPYPPHGGVLQRGFNLLRQASRDARIHLLAFVHPDVLPTEDAVDRSRSVLGEFCETVEYFPLWAKASPLSRAAAVALSSVSATPFSVIAHRSTSFRQRVAEICRSVPLDVIHVDTVALSQFVEPRARIAKVLTHHNVESILMRRRSDVETRWLARRFLRREAAKLEALEYATSAQYDVNVMMSASDAAALSSKVPGIRTAIVPNGVDTDYFSPAADGETKAVVYAGGLNMFANRDAVMHFLREIWPVLKTEVPGLRFFVVGQDPPKELCDLAKADQQIVVTGYVDDIRPYVRQSAVYVVPLRVGGGTRLKVLDAMAMGKAIVSTSIGCEGLEVTPGEHLLVADTTEAFAKATRALLENPERRQSLGCAARQLVERKYAWPIAARQLLDVYRMAMASNRLSP